MTRRAVVARLALPAALVLATLAPGTVRAADVDWGTPSATAEYGERVVFEQPLTVTGDVTRAELLLEFPGSIGPAVTEVDAPPAGRATLRHLIDVAQGHLLPNTTLTARWRVTGADGSEDVGPATTVRYEDTRFEWETRQGDVVRVHWYEGGDAFGDRALQIGERAVRETAELLGVTEREPVDFFVYADQEAFYEALGPGTRENVGGQANAALRTLYALIPPGQIDDPWVGIVIPHELVHLVFDTAVDNPYHFPPRWLNEGLAVYLSQGYDIGDRALVEQASTDGELIPLDGLTGQFPTTRERFFLAYAESVSAVDFFIRQHNRDALVALVRSYATGLTDDDAFEQAIGMDAAEFDAAWRADLRAGDPTAYGPQEAPAGPLPPGWSADGSPGPSAEPAPGGTTAPGAPLPGDADDDGDDGGSILPVAIALALAALLAVIVLRGRGRRATAGRPSVVAGPFPPATVDDADQPPAAPREPPDAPAP